MVILLNKNNKNGEIINIQNYSEILKFELLQYFSKIISNFVSENEYQRAIEYVEKQVNKTFEIPLRINNNLHLNGTLNELIINEKAKFMNFFVYLKKELTSCNKFYFIVSFIKYSGIQLLINTLDELEKKGIKGEIITSVYLNITDPKALRKLHSYKNIKVKIYNSNESFHTKAYLFEKDVYSTCIIGSSNISQSALYSAEEWNVKLTSNDFFDIYSKCIKQFEILWNSDEAIELTEDFINKYENYRNINNKIETFNYKKLENENGKFSPNSMQIEILEKLKNNRNIGNKKGLVVAATGTGKTYLAAMDIKNYFENKNQVNNKKFLFIAHREELLDNAINVCSTIFNENVQKFGKLYGGKKEFDKKMIFASIQTLRNYYEHFSKDYFDYIVIDEFHHASASSYEKIINYFKSDFLLGLTATPERMDGKDILTLCDYNLIGEIGLKKAMEQDLIVPFHYFGVDDTVNYENIKYINGKYDEEKLIEKLIDNSRVDYIIKKIKSIGYDGNKMSCVAFCENIEHAQFMKNSFEKNGYISEIITANTNSTERSKILEKFKNNNIEILCVVDILNEGVDIPNINLLLFLRPTMSSTIFIQQIGRGLRKAKNKEFVTIIDFIGNHKKDYLITKVFSEEIDNKNIIYDKKEKIINEIKNQFSNIPGASYIELDRICQERIINKIEKINFSSKNILKDLYVEHKNEVGKSENSYLEYNDFNFNINLLKELILKFGSFYNAQLILENSDFPNEISLKNEENDLLAYFERKLTLVEPFTYLILKMFLKSKYESQNLKITEKNILNEYYKYFQLKFEHKNEYLIERLLKELCEDKILEKKNDYYILNKKYEIIFNKDNNCFWNRVEQLVNLGLIEFKKNDLKQFNENILITHKEYMRIDLQILLNSQVPKGTWRAGYANTEKDICLFVTNDKSHIQKENLKYDNSLHSDEIIQWISQPKTYHDSSVGQMFIKHKEKGMKVHIFARKYAFMNGNKTNPFIYLGNADYYSSFGDKPMTILWKLHTKIPQNIIHELYNIEND